MLSEACRAFREGFEAGRIDPHAETCPECKAWADTVLGLRALGVDLPLPEALRDRLVRIPRALGPDAGAPDGDEDAPSLSPLPQLPLPLALRERLRRIPAVRGTGAPPRWTARSRDLLAASCLLAFLLAPVVNRHAMAGESALGVFSRGFDLILGEAGSKGDRVLSQFGDVIFRGCELASDTMGGLLGRLSAPPPKPQESRKKPGSEKGSAGGDSPSREKEKPHGNRQAP